MPNTYLQGAANQIRQAISNKRAEIDQKRRLIDDKTKESQQVIENLRAQIRAVEADMARPPEKQEDPNTDRAQKSRIVLDRQKEIAIKERDFMMEKDRLLREIRDQENDLLDLDGQARDLENRD